jgi:CxxC motif-containing protein (DUF1111 family)
MRFATVRNFTGALSVAAAAGVSAWVMYPQLGQSQSSLTTAGPTDPGVRAGGAGAGSPLLGLTSGQLQFFNEGKEAFEEIAFVQNAPAGSDSGLGPGFNSDSCQSCHAFPATGGSSPRVNPQVAVATKLGARNRLPSFIRPDGPVLEVRFQFNRDGSRDGGVHNLFSIAGRSDASGCNMPQESFTNTGNMVFRAPTPTFGLGLIESIPDSALRANLQDSGFLKAVAGISGKLNTNGNDGTVTRFGWKAQNKSIAIFSGEAYNVEMGISNALFPQERNEIAGCMYNATAEDGINFDTGEHDDVALFSAFMRFLAPPARGPIGQSERDGQDAFNRVGCNLCHTPSLTTGTSPIAALSQKPVPLFSDLALHSMGPGLADDVQQGGAAGDEFRTAPLWGTGQRIFFLHDGRTKDLLSAIRAHASDGNRQFRASEANQVIQRFNALPVAQQQNILNFLRSL